MDLEDLLTALSPEEVAHLVDEMAADPDDKHMPASVRSVVMEVILTFPPFSSNQDFV